MNNKNHMEGATPDEKKHKSMTPEQKAKRKRTMLSNAAEKAFSRRSSV